MLIQPWWLGGRAVVWEQNSLYLGVSNPAWGMKISYAVDCVITLVEVSEKWAIRIHEHVYTSIIWVNYKLKIVICNMCVIDVWNIGKKYY